MSNPDFNVSYTAGSIANTLYGAKKVASGLKSSAPNSSQTLVTTTGSATQAFSVSGTGMLQSIDGARITINSINGAIDGGNASTSLNGNNPNNSMNNEGSKDYKNYTAKETERKYDLKKGQFHEIKQDVIKDISSKSSPYRDLMKKVGNNPDIHLSSDGTIRIMSRNGKTSFDTILNIKDFLP